MSSFNLNALVRPNVKAMRRYASARDEYSDSSAGMVFLDANENPFESGVNRYPDPQQRKLKEILAQQRGVNSSQMLLGNGSDEVLDLIYRAFCIPEKDNVIVLPPTYGMYTVLGETNAIEVCEVQLNDDFQPNVPRILELANASTKLLFLCSPNNPTGNLMRTDLVTALLNEFHGIVIIDEAYIDFTESESWARQLNQFPNLIVTQTLSKAYGLAGIRLGIGMASTDIIEVLNKIKPPYNVNQLTQNKAADRIAKVKDYETERKIILQERQKLEYALGQSKFITQVFPSEANFILVRVDNAEKRYAEFIDKGIVVRNRSKQALCANTLRFTVGTPAENSKLITTIQEMN